MYEQAELQASIRFEGLQDHYPSDGIAAWRVERNVE